MQRIKTGDKVIVIAGKFKKTVTTVTRVDGDKLYLKDVNMMKKAKKGQGFIDIHHPIHGSNVSVLDPKTNTPTRV
jgi:large subunit ribosomal protein L24